MSYGRMIVLQIGPTKVTNPDAAVEMCECGHDEADHLGGEMDMQTGLTEIFDKECQCGCKVYRPRDDKYYTDLADEARLERWESER